MPAIDVANTEIVIIDQYFANTVSDVVSIKKEPIIDGLLDYGTVDPAYRFRIAQYGQ